MDVTSSLPLTGERTVPGVASENYWFRRHQAAYSWLLPLVAGRRVLEVGCGEGYGTDMIADAARSVLGLDYDAASVRHARSTYPRADFARANLAALPLGDATVDVVVTLQVIEHVWDHPQFVSECARVLRPGGSIVVTTPNRLTFSPGRDVALNPFHTHEFTAAELTGLLERCGFDVTAVLGLHAGDELAALDARYRSFTDAQLAVAPALWSAQLLADVASVRAEHFLILAAEVAPVDAALDLVVLAQPRR